MLLLEELFVSLLWLVAEANSCGTGFGLVELYNALLSLLFILGFGLGLVSLVADYEALLFLGAVILGFVVLSFGEVEVIDGEPFGLLG